MKLDYIKNLIKRIILPKDKFTPEVGCINFGDFNRSKPFSTDWGFKRGGSIDRIFIEKFLHDHRDCVHGIGLEVMNDNYLKQYGQERITHTDILDIDTNNKRATLITDLSKADIIPSNKYDCFILTQTIQQIFDVHSALKHAYRILKPGGTLLLTVPGISHYPYKTGPIRYWSFTEHAVKKLLEEHFNSNQITTQIYGNVGLASAFLFGVGKGELNQNLIKEQDPNYQLIIAAKAVK